MNIKKMIMVLLLIVTYSLAIAGDCFEQWQQKCENNRKAGITSMEVYYETKEEYEKCKETQKIKKKKIKTGEKIIRQKFISNNTKKYSNKIFSIKINDLHVEKKYYDRNYFHQRTKITIEIKNISKNKIIKAKFTSCFDYTDGNGISKFSCLPDGISIKDNFGNVLNISTHRDCDGYTEHRIFPNEKEEITFYFDRPIKNSILYIKIDLYKIKPYSKLEKVVFKIPCNEIMFDK